MRKQPGANAEQEHSAHLHRHRKIAMKSAAHRTSSWMEKLSYVRTQVDAPVDGSEELGAAEREHVGLQERLAGAGGGVVRHVHDPGSAVSALQRHRLDSEERNCDYICDRSTGLLEVLDHVHACSGRVRRRRCPGGRRGARARRDRTTRTRGERSLGSTRPRARRSPAAATRAPARTAAAGRAPARRTRPARPARGPPRLRKRACRRARWTCSRSTRAAAAGAAGRTRRWMAWGLPPFRLVSGARADARRGRICWRNWAGVGQRGLTMDGYFSCLHFWLLSSRARAPVIFLIKNIFARWV